MAAFSQVAHQWSSADSDERIVLARGLFQYLVFDLDKQQIVDFRLHPWADQYLMLRADLYEDDDTDTDDGAEDDSEGNENRFITLSSDEAICSPNGLSPLNTYLELGGLTAAKNLVFFIVYFEQDFVPRLTTEQRDKQIRDRNKCGEGISALAREFGISPQRVDQIVRGRRK